MQADVFIVCLYGIYDPTKKNSTMSEYRDYLSLCAEKIFHIQAEQPVIILCGGYINGSEISEAESVEECFKMQLEAIGVTDPMVYLETRSQNSPENIAYAYASINEIGIHVRSAIILCDTFRAFKLRLISLRIMKGIAIKVIGIERIDVSPHAKKWLQIATGIWYFFVPRALRKAIRP